MANYIADAFLFSERSVVESQLLHLAKELTPLLCYAVVARREEADL
jgi:hypothetical protein